MAEAARLFETTWEVLKKMDVKTFMRLYRQQAKKHHPDQGGDQKSFVKLTELYESMLRKKK
jgi:DnaJ-class molecular chaperone